MDEDRNVFIKYIFTKLKKIRLLSFIFLIKLIAQTYLIKYQVVKKKNKEKKNSYRFVCKQLLWVKRTGHIPGYSSESRNGYKLVSG